MDINNETRDSRLESLSVDELKVCAYTIEALKKSGINTIADVLKYARTKGRLMYLPEIRECDEREVVFALYEYGIDFLYPQLDAVAWMKIFDERGYRQYQRYQTEVLTEASMYAGGMAQALPDAIDDKRMAHALCDGIGISTVGELMVYAFIHAGEAFEDIDGIGEKYAEKLDNVMVEKGWNKDFDFLSTKDQQYVKHLMLNVRLYDIMKDKTRSFMELQNKGFSRLRDIAMYIREGNSLEDLFNQLGMVEEYKEFGPIFMRALRSVDALTCPTL